MILIQTKDGMVCLPDHQVLSVRHNKQARTVNVVWLGTNPPTTYPDVISCTYTTEGQKVTVEDIGSDMESLRKRNEEIWELDKLQRKVIQHLEDALNDVFKRLYEIYPPAPENIRGALHKIANDASTAASWREDPDFRCQVK
jgi:hypothetical protein